MPERTFDFCALQYLNLWLEKESHYCRMLSSSIDEQIVAVKKAAGYFRVGRNLPKKFEKNNDYRYQPVLEVLNRVGSLTEENTIHIVADTCKQISEHYGGRNVLSLTTKFLWLKFKSPVRIYDRQARTAINTPPNNYACFHEAFLEQYSSYKEPIEAACDNLKNMLSFTVQPQMKQKDIKNIIHKDWFHERVFDIYLWNKGNINK